jgi:hypothetical protein
MCLLTTVKTTVLPDSNKIWWSVHNRNKINISYEIFSYEIQLYLTMKHDQTFCYACYWWIGRYIECLWSIIKKQLFQGKKKYQGAPAMQTTNLNITLKPWLSSAKNKHECVHVCKKVVHVPLMEKICNIELWSPKEIYFTAEGTKTINDRITKSFMLCWFGIKTSSKFKRI